MNKELLLSYAHAFTSFLFRSAGIRYGAIKGIYLFGSVARGDFDAESDVDIFIDVNKSNEKETRKLSSIALRNFYRSAEFKKFQLLGITNPISVKCGEVNKWAIHESIKKEGNVLYASSLSPLLRKYFLIEIKPISDVTKRNRIVRKLAGRKEAKRKESGLVEEIGGQAIDSRHYIVPSERISAVTGILSRENAFFELREVWMH